MAASKQDKKNVFTGVVFLLLGLYLYATKKKTLTPVVEVGQGDFDNSFDFDETDIVEMPTTVKTPNFNPSATSKSFVSNEIDNAKNSFTNC
ncbi:structural protein [Cellulophaga phage phi48:2]|uniref:structural protein n=1 Tax=Cellulophaga phage phi48:2 TaxID=1327968 RepID=UPI000351A0E2|nr:structural protein [Cellulophaga phage phi48:2]AGO47263.1 structural protein [Cellulophaga phage phi48:2]